MGNGKWKIENEEWGIESKERRMGMENGKLKTGICFHISSFKIYLLQGTDIFHRYPHSLSKTFSGKISSDIPQF